MSGLEPFIASALASVGTAGTAAAGTTAAATAGTAAATTAATTAAAAGTAAAATGAAAAGATAAGAGTLAGLTTAELITAGSTLASAAGAGASLLAKPPKINAPSMPTRDNARAEADQRSLALKRRGRAATLLTGSEGVTSAPTLGSPSLTGTA